MAHYSEATKLAVWITVICGSVVAASLMIWGLLRFRRMLQLTIVQKRYPRIVLLESMMAIVVTVVYIPFTRPLGLDLFSDYQRTIDFITISTYPIVHAYVPYPFRSEAAGLYDLIVFA